jgi:hypothetical protein
MDKDTESPQAPANPTLKSQPRKLSEFLRDNGVQPGHWALLVSEDASASARQKEVFGKGETVSHEDVSAWGEVNLLSASVASGTDPGPRLCDAFSTLEFGLDRMDVSSIVWWRNTIEVALQNTPQGHNMMKSIIVRFNEVLEFDHHRDDHFHALSTVSNIVTEKALLGFRGVRFSELYCATLTYGLSPGWQPDEDLSRICFSYVPHDGRVAHYSHREQLVLWNGTFRASEKCVVSTVPLSEGMFKQALDGFGGGKAWPCVATRRVFSARREMLKIVPLEGGASVIENALSINRGYYYFREKQGGKLVTVRYTEKTSRFSTFNFIRTNDVFLLAQKSAANGRFRLTPKVKIQTMAVPLLNALHFAVNRTAMGLNIPVSGVFPSGMMFAHDEISRSYAFGTQLSAIESYTHRLLMYVSGIYTGTVHYDLRELVYPRETPLNISAFRAALGEILLNANFL